MEHELMSRYGNDAAKFFSLNVSALAGFKENTKNNLEGV
jgi:hypothetical protein